MCTHKRYRVPWTTTVCRYLVPVPYMLCYLYLTLQWYQYHVPFYGLPTVPHPAAAQAQVFLSLKKSLVVNEHFDRDCTVHTH